MGFEEFVPIIFVLIVIAVAVYVQHVRAEQRRRDWRRVAASLGCRVDHSSVYPSFWTLFAAPDPTPAAYPHSLFQQGHARRAPNVMTGTVGGHAITCFDYQYTIGHGKNSRTYYFLCLVIPAPTALVHLQVRPEGVGDKLAGFLGARDIQFESDEFNGRFHVECDEPRFAFDLLHPRSMELLLRSSGLSLEGAERELLFCMPRTEESRCGGLDGFVRYLLQYGTEFTELIPEYLETRDAR